MTDRFFEQFGMSGLLAQPEISAATALAIYVHWPWCLRKCPYCDFNSHAASGGVETQQADDYTEALREELRGWRAKTGPRRITSVFFGGGTPTLMGDRRIGEVLAEISQLYGLPADAEITVEGNPTSASYALYQGLKLVGVNRVSVGVQALEDQDLRFLGREHSAAQAWQTLEAALRVFDNVNADVMYGLPEQNLAKWVENLEKLTTLKLNHVSAYQLTIETNTAFYSDVKRQKWAPADSDTQADFGLVTQQVLGTAGYEHYEVSNHALPGKACRHNLHVWEYGDYLGIGAGAHGRVRLTDRGRWASRVKRSPEKYLAYWRTHLRPSPQAKTLLNNPLSVKSVAAWEALQEAFMLGLRLTSGINIEKVAKLTWGAEWSDSLALHEIATLTAQGLLEIEHTQLRATKLGLWHLDRILREVLV